MSFAFKWEKNVQNIAKFTLTLNQYKVSIHKNLNTSTCKTHEVFIFLVLLNNIYYFQHESQAKVHNWNQMKRLNGNSVAISNKQL